MGRPKGKRQSTKQPPLVDDSAEPLRDPRGLHPRERLFVEAYCGVAKFNATKAYELAGYKPSRHNAARLITREHIAQAIAEKVLVAADIMGGEEALLRISRYGRGDIRLLFPEDHKYRKLPDEIALCIKAITPTRYGDRIELIDPLRANELMAKVAGRLKETLTVEHTLEEILAASWDAPAAAEAK